MIIKAIVTDFTFLLKGEINFEIDYNKTFQEVKNIYFEKLKENNIETNNYCNYDSFKIIVGGKIVKMEDDIYNYMGYDNIVMKIAF